MSPARPSARRGAVGLFLCLLGFSLLFFHGQLEVSDEQQMALTTRSLAERLSLTWDQEFMGLRFSGYGIGTPLAALPFYFLDLLLVRSGVMAGVPWNLLPLTNAVLFALLGVLAASLMEGERRWAASALVLVASPLLPASLSFTSEPLAAAGLMALAAGLWHEAPERRWPVVLAFAGALAAVLARVATVPLAGLVLVWGLRSGAPLRALTAGAGGVAVGMAAAMAQNMALRGSIFATGYGGQEFTTPLTTGLYGLLVSPERGLLIFFPAVLAPLLGWEYLRGRARALAVLAGSLLIFSTIFHGLFWTWHGGWTAGPRFLLPALAFAVPPVAELLRRRAELPRRLQVFLGAALAWSLLLAVVYSRHSAHAWWNQLWGFHEQENQWLFLPQMALWTAWLQDIPLAVRQSGMGWQGMAIHGAGLAMVLVSLPILGAAVLADGRSEAEILEQVKSVLRWRPGAATCFALAGVLFLFGIVAMLKGPRGWRSDSGEPGPAWMLTEGPGGRFEALIDYPLNGPIRFAARANALYHVDVDSQRIAEETRPLRQHLPRFSVSLPAGQHLLEVATAPKDDSTPALFQLYWTWGGEGRYLEPVGGEYVLPRELTPVERVATRIWRRRWHLVAGVLALVLLLRGLRSRGNGPEGF